MEVWGTRHKTQEAKTNYETHKTTQDTDKMNMNYTTTSGKEITITPEQDAKMGAFHEACEAKGVDIEGVELSWDTDENGDLVVGELCGYQGTGRKLIGNDEDIIIQTGAEFGYKITSYSRR